MHNMKGRRKNIYDKTCFWNGGSIFRRGGSILSDGEVSLHCRAQRLFGSSPTITTTKPQNTGKRKKTT